MSNSLRQTNLKLVGDAYSSIKLTQFASLLGVNESEARDLASREGWSVVSDHIIPTGSRGDRSLGSSSDDQLEKIIHFVSYLEN